MHPAAISLAAALLLMPAVATAQTVRVTESDGVVVPIGQDVASVLIANPDIANVQPLSDRSLFLYGKEEGATRLFVMNNEDEVILERRVVVTRSLHQLQSAVRGAVAD